MRTGILFFILGLSYGFSAPSIGASTWKHYGWQETSATTLTSDAITTQAGGSCFVMLIGRGDTNGFVNTPTDNKGNTYYRQGNFQIYPVTFYTSGDAVYIATNATGGSGHTFSVGCPALDETSMAVLEVKNANRYGSVTHTWDLASPNVSASVTTSESAVLVATWNGNATDQANLSIGNGWAIQAGKYDGGLYVQGAIAAKVVNGTDSASWTPSPDQDANLWIMDFYGPGTNSSFTTVNAGTLIKR